MLPEAGTAAVLEFITGALLSNPDTSARNRGELEGRCAARRDAYRLIYRIDHASRRVAVLRSSTGQTRLPPP